MFGADLGTLAAAVWFRDVDIDDEVAGVLREATSPTDALLELAGCLSTSFALEVAGERAKTAAAEQGRAEDARRHTHELSQLETRIGNLELARATATTAADYWMRRFHGATDEEARAAVTKPRPTEDVSIPKQPYETPTLEELGTEPPPGSTLRQEDDAGG